MVDGKGLLLHLSSFLIMPIGDQLELKLKTMVTTLTKPVVALIARPTLIWLTSKPSLKSMTSLFLKNLSMAPVKR